MKSILTAVVVIVVLIALILVLGGNESTDGSMSGEIIDVSQTSIIIDAGKSEREFLITPDTVITNITGEAVSPSYLRIGFSADVEGTINGDEWVADSITTTEEPNLLLFNLNPDDSISSPVTVTGEARLWYFEASFPVSIIGPDGEVIAQAPATAQGEWMTENYVPFEVTLTWEGNLEGDGEILFEKSNPSGLPEHAESMSVPVTFEDDGSATDQFMTIEAYYSRDIPGEETLDCDEVFPVQRTIPRTVAVAEAALTELLKGPSSAESRSYYVTNIPEGAQLQSIRIEDGIAYADFNEALDASVAGSCRVIAVRAQITRTLEQFPTISQVVISINGDTEEILQP